MNGIQRNDGELWEELIGRLQIHIIFSEGFNQHVF